LSVLSKLEVGSWELIWRPLLLHREVDRDRHDDRHRHAVEDRGGELPLRHGISRRLIERGDRAQHPRVVDRAAAVDRGLYDDDALDAGRLRVGGIDGWHVTELGGWLDAATDTEWRPA